MWKVEWTGASDEDAQRVLLEAQCRGHAVQSVRVDALTALIEWKNSVTYNAARSWVSRCLDTMSSLKVKAKKQKLADFKWTLSVGYSEQVGASAAFELALASSSSSTSPPPPERLLVVKLLALMQGAESFPYELEGTLGNGTFGTVYSSRSCSSLPVAVKKLQLATILPVRSFSGHKPKRPAES